MEKLLKKADKKARILAKKLNATLGEAFSYNELEDSDHSLAVIKNFLDLLSAASPGWHTTVGDKDGVYEKSISVEYLIAQKIDIK